MAAASSPSRRVPASMLNCKRTALGAAVLLALTAPGMLRAQESNRIIWPATLLENAQTLQERRTLFFGGLEFEEDSGDFPTSKVAIHLVHGLTDKLMLEASGLLVRFNDGDYTAWGGAETNLGLQYQVQPGKGSAPAVQLRGSVAAPTGGMTTGGWFGTGGVDLSWQKSRWGFHLNGQHSAGEANDKMLGVSEVDRWRIAGGVDRSAFPLQGWTWTVAVVGAKPMRPKPNEWTLEIGIHAPVKGPLSLNAGWAQGLREKGVEWLVRFGFVVAM